MTDIPDLPIAILTGNDRNSQRCKRVRAYLDYLTGKDAPEEVIAPYLAELKRRLAGNKVGEPGVDISVPRR